MTPRNPKSRDHGFETQKPRITGLKPRITGSPDSNPETQNHEITGLKPSIHVSLDHRFYTQKLLITCLKASNPKSCDPVILGFKPVIPMILGLRIQDPLPLARPRPARRPLPARFLIKAQAPSPQESGVLWVRIFFGRSSQNTTRMVMGE